MATSSLKDSGANKAASIPQTQMDRQLTLLHDALLILDGRLMSLTNNLSSVLRNEDIEKSADPEPADSLVLRADSIRSARWKVASLVSHVENLIERLEA